MFKQNTTKQFKQIFEARSAGELEQETRTLESKWGWLNIVFSLCNGDILNVDKVTKLKLYTVLTYMCYTQDKQSEGNSNYNNFK